MKTAKWTITTALAAVLMYACGGPATGDAAKNANAASTTTTKHVAAPPTKDALFALDKQANEAWIKGDSKFFEGIVSDKFLAWDGGRRMDKAAVLKMIASGKCEMKDWKLEDPTMSTIDTDSAVVSYKGTFDGTCTGPDGKPMKVPSPVRAATLWVRSGDTWQAAFHAENLIFDPKSSPPPPAAPVNSKPAATKPAADPITDALVAVETNVWEAWKEHDAKKLEDLTTKDLTFVNIFGTYFANKADTMTNWTGGYCEIASVSVTDGVGRSLSPTLGILTVKGNAHGTCDGQELAPVDVYGTTVYVKDGDAWKMAFGFNRLLN